MHAKDIEDNPIEYDPQAEPAPDALLFAGGEYATAMIGAAADGRAVYDLDRMVDWAMRSNGWDYADALEYIEYNVLGSLPNAGPRGPIVVQR